MVKLLDSLEKLKEHANYCRYVQYKIDEVEHGYRVRIEAGSYGWDVVVNGEEKEKIREWLEFIGAARVVGQVSEDMFFI